MEDKRDEVQKLLLWEGMEGIKSLTEKASTTYKLVVNLILTYMPETLFDHCFF